MHTKNVILALALAAAAMEPPARRRLRDTVDLASARRRKLKLTGALSFKLDATAAAEHGDALAHRVADLIECSKAERTFSHAGIHEENVAKGLHLWYSVKCADGAEDRAVASTKAAAKLHAYLDRSDEDHEGVQLIEPALVHLSTTHRTRRGRRRSVLLVPGWPLRRRQQRPGGKRPWVAPASSCRSSIRASTWTTKTYR